MMEILKIIAREICKALGVEFKISTQIIGLPITIAIIVTMIIGSIITFFKSRKNRKY